MNIGIGNRQGIGGKIAESFDITFRGEFYCLCDCDCIIECM